MLWRVTSRETHKVHGNTIFAAAKNREKGKYVISTLFVMKKL